MIFGKNNHYFGIIATPIQEDINILPVNFLIECIKLQLDIEHSKEKSIVSLFVPYNK